jgi:hypothetical protein
MTRQRLNEEAGFTVAEMLIASAIMLTITGTVFSLLNPAQGIYKTQPEVADVQQRMRVGVDSLSKDLMMAGAGTYFGTSAGALVNYFAPIMPYRIITDPAAGVYFRSDAISLVYVPPTPSQTTVREEMPQNSQEFKVNAQSNCPKNKQLQLCGFRDNMRVMIFSPTGAWEPTTLTNVQDPALHLQHSGKLRNSYPLGSWITQVATQTYYLKTDVATNTYQLMYTDGDSVGLPVVDNVVKLEFQYYGEPQPPALLPGKSLADAVGPYTTYGPKPPVLGVDNPNDTWPAGENCTFMVQNGQQVPRLPLLEVGHAQVALPANILTDGPWCPDSQTFSPYDADLLRIRKIRIKLRVQAGPASMRGPTGVLFTRGGTATSRLVPDQEISFDITPRNANLGR